MHNDEHDGSTAAGSDGDSATAREDTETVLRLELGMTGRWLVTAGSTHVWDLDEGTYERRPGPRSRAGGFAHDRRPHPITRVEWWPEVGARSFVWFDDPDNPVMELYRVSSTIVEIRRVGVMPRHVGREPATTRSDVLDRDTPDLGNHRTHQAERFGTRR